jgi:transcriptional regulator with XRE-family HTH domain
MAKLSERDRERLSLFVDEMIAQRTARGWSQADLATQTNYSRGLIGAVETYERAPTEPLAKALDQAFGLPKTFERLQKKVRSMAFPAAFGEFAEHEAKANTLFILEHAYIPGLLQTEGYARTVLEQHLNVTQAEVAERLSNRLGRQEILKRKDASRPVLWVLIDEFVLDREIGGPLVMADQLASLAEAATLINVTVQVIPRGAGSHPGLLGHYVIAERHRPEGAAGIVFIEGADDGRITDDPETVAEIMQRWRYLGSLALPVGPSLELIQERQERWTKTAKERGVSRLTPVATEDPASK